MGLGSRPTSEGSLGRNMKLATPVMPLSTPGSSSAYWVRGKRRGRGRVRAGAGGRVRAGAGGRGRARVIVS